MPRKKSEPDSTLVFLVAKLFFQGKKVREIVQQVNKLIPGKVLKRESVYPLLATARERRYVRLAPPLEDRLAARHAARMASSGLERIGPRMEGMVQKEQP